VSLASPVSLVLFFAGASLHVTDHNGRTPWSLASGEHSVQASSSISGAARAAFSQRQRFSLPDSFSDYIRSLSDLMNICKSPTSSLEEATSCVCDAPELSRLRLAFASAKGFTPLHEASRRGRADLVAFLLEQKADPNACSFAQGQNIQADEDSQATSLHVAAANGHSQVVELLLRARADVGAVTAQGASALLLSFGIDDGPHVDVARLIVQEMLSEEQLGGSRIGKLINHADAFECTPLHTAAKKGSVTVVELLLSVKAVQVNQVNMSGQTPLHVASIFGHSDVVRTIAKFKECDVNLRVQAKLRESSLHLAARRGFFDVLLALGVAGAHFVIEAKDSAGKIKPFQAISNESPERPSPIDVAQDGEVREFLQTTLDFFRLCQGEPASSSNKTIHGILAAPRTRRAFLNFRTSANNTPLHIAALSKNARGTAWFGEQGLYLYFLFFNF
jgi:ankyrin repeat protein